MDLRTPRFSRNPRSVLDHRLSLIILKWLLEYIQTMSLKWTSQQSPSHVSLRSTPISPREPLGPKHVVSIRSPTFTYNLQTPSTPPHLVILRKMIRIIISGQPPDQALISQIWMTFFCAGRLFLFQYDTNPIFSSILL